jgi:phosphohistidine phosphatase SixA
MRGKFLTLACTILMPVAALMGANRAGAEDAELWESLKHGGYVLLVRHAATPLTRSPIRSSRGGCVPDRDLTDAGQLLAQKLGLAFRAHGVPVTRVLSSPACQSMETAHIAFGGAEPWSDPDPAGDRRAWLVRNMNALASQTSTTGNVVLVTDKLAISDMTDRTVSAGDVVVLKRSGEQFDVQGLLSAAP